RPAVHRRPPPDRAPAGRADGACRRPKGAWRARAHDRREGQGDVRGDRQCRPVLWRRHLHRDRIDRADPADPVDLRLQYRAAAPRLVGNPERDLRFLHSLGAAAPVRPEAEAPQVITLHWLYALAGAMCAAFALLSVLDRSNRKRLGNAAFWGLMALSLLAGDTIGDFGNGLVGLGLAINRGVHPVRRGASPAD